MKKLLAWLTAVCLLVLPARGQFTGPFETLLLLDGQGAANDPLYVGWTQTTGFSTGIARSVNPQTLSQGSVQTLTMGFSKVLDPASAVIFDKLTRRQGQATMKIVFVQADRGDRIELWSLLLEDVRFTSIVTELASSAGPPTDKVEFVARTAEWRYVSAAAPVGGRSALERKAQIRALAFASAVGPQMFTRFDSFTGTATSGSSAPTFPGLVDTDGDGMSDAYETTHGLNRLGNDAALDPDGDGLTNLMESICDTDPNRPDSVLRMKITPLGGGMMELRWTARADLIYQIQGSPNLGTPFTTLQSVPATADGELVRTVPSAPNKFFRLQVSR